MRFLARHFSRRGLLLMAVGLVVWLVGLVPWYLTDYRSGLHLYGGLALYAVGFAFFFGGGLMGRRDAAKPPA